jgi:hypothetical protein
MESRWTPETSETDLRGQISMACGALYINGNLLKRRCLKWARIAHLDIWNTSYDQKKGQESNSRESASFDSRPLKVRNRHEILGCRRRATYRWKALDESYNFALDRTSIQGLLAKLWASKSRKSRRARFRDSRAGVPGVPGEKSHLDVGPVESHKVYYKGEGGGFPQVRAMDSLACPCEWISLWILPSPIPELQHAPLPLKVLWAREHISTPPSSAVFHLDSHLSPSRSWECVMQPWPHPLGFSLFPCKGV